VPEALKGVALGGLWLLDRGAWMPCAASAAWTWAMGPVTQGDLLDLRFATGHAETVVVVMALAAAAALSSARVLGISRKAPGGGEPR
jgi:hypothetical protein